MAIFFWMNDPERTTALAIGAVPESIEDVPPCSLLVGDIVSFPGPPQGVYVVATRLYNHRLRRWELQLVDR